MVISTVFNMKFMLCLECGSVFHTTFTLMAIFSKVVYNIREMYGHM